MNSELLFQFDEMGTFIIRDEIKYLEGGKLVGNNIIDAWSSIMNEEAHNQLPLQRLFLTTNAIVSLILYTQIIYSNNDKELATLTIDVLYVIRVY